MTTEICGICERESGPSVNQSLQYSRDFERRVCLKCAINWNIVKGEAMKGFLRWKGEP